MTRVSYHHGNLRQALVDATAALIQQKGPMAFTLAEAARQAGVSAAAPYRHFAGRDQLLEEVARQGFLEFAALLEAAFDGGRPSALSAFLRMGEAYLGFAAARPGFYMAMFESGLSIAGNADLAAAAERAELALVRAAEAL
ncbi:MAG TPA: TetR/AcrR family transcriptional regulator, partial [Paracoccus sp.]|nr:TetR/AcrR family transcriptional regulator [Paracoccus sp. (in: a-proteobacteria)]